MVGLTTIDPELTETILTILEKNRPQITPSTRRTYASILSTLYRNMRGDEGRDKREIKAYFNNNSDEVVEFIRKTYPKPSAIKTRMASLISFLGPKASEDAIKTYRLAMTENALKQKELYESQEKTPEQRENWVNYDDIVKKLELLKNKTNAILKLGQKCYTMKEMQDIQEYVILSLYTLIPPRRLTDFIFMKYQNYDEEDDNYIDFDKKKLVFNIYKTAKIYKTQTESLPDRLANILKKWIKIIDGRSDFILIDRNFDQLSQAQLQQRINKIFGGKKVSVNIIRHSYLSRKYGNDTDLKERLDDAKAMGHSLEMQSQYVVK